MEEYDEQRLKLESLGQLNQVTELDSKANRYDAGAHMYSIFARS